MNSINSMEKPTNFNNSSISILQDSYQDISMAIVNNYIAQRYAFSVVNTQATKDDFWTFIDKLKQEYDELNILTNKFELSPTNRLYYIEDTKSHFMIIADMSAGLGEILSVNIFGKDIKIATEYDPVFWKASCIKKQKKVRKNNNPNNTNNNINSNNDDVNENNDENDITMNYSIIDENEIINDSQEINENIYETI